MAEDKIIEKLLEHDQKFDVIQFEIKEMNQKLQTLTEKSDDNFRRSYEILEELVTMVKKIQEDHVFALEWLKRLQDQLERQEQEIIRIKQQLKMA